MTRKVKSKLKMVFVLIAVTVLASSVQLLAEAGGERLLPIYCVEKDEKVVSLTFDAAWGNEDTQHLIDIFAKYNVKVTFFVVGAWAEKYPESVKALYDAGHEVMNHSNDHAHFASLSSGQIVENIGKCSDKVEKITGVRPTLFRAPYGEYDNEVIASVTSMNMYTIQWDVDSLDWKGISASEITQRVTSRVAPGSIVLFHNAAIHTPEALPGIIDFLLAQGYKIVPVSQLIIHDNFTIDNAGRQHKAG